MGWGMTEAGWLSGWFAECRPDAPVKVRVRFPDIDWEVEDWAFGLSESLSEPEIVVDVRLFDFDYPGVAEKLKRLADDLAYYNFVD